MEVTGEIYEAIVREARTLGIYDSRRGIAEASSRVVLYATVTAGLSDGRVSELSDEQKAEVFEAYENARRGEAGEGRG